MSFNIPITIHGDVSMDGITRPYGDGSLELGSVLELSQVMIKLNEAKDMQEKRCAHCREDLDPDRPLHLFGDETDTSDYCEENPDSDGGEAPLSPHVAEWSPLTWAKNIAVSFDEERDEIELAIATGEPRGGWTFKLYRNSDGVIVMHLPHADMDSPHEPIRELHPGTFIIG